MYSNEAVFVGSMLAAASIVASTVSARLGAPLLLVFLVLGMLAGEDGPIGIEFDDMDLAQLVGGIALAIIIFDGGLRTRKDVFRVALWPAISLATIGVILTALFVGAFATWLLGIGWLEGLLIGAIVGSTDAAAVFGLLGTARTQLKTRVAATLEIESASNDPMAIFITIALVGLLAAGETNLHVSIVSQFVQQFGTGALSGWLGGCALAALINRVRLVSGLYPLLAAAGGLVVYSTADMIGGSGFLAIYIAGIVLGNTPLQSSQTILRVHDGLAWLSQITMFLMLGLLVTPRDLVDYAFEGLALALALILFCRPLAVMASLLPFKFPRREQLFIGWVGLRGAVPMILAIFPVTAGIERSALYFNVAFFIVLVSLVIHGWTIAPAARLLELEVPPGIEPLRRYNLDIPGDFEHEMAAYRVLPGSLAAGQRIANLPIPAGSRVTTVIRGKQVLTVHEHLELACGDVVFVFHEPADVPRLNLVFDPHDVPGRFKDRRFYGDFVLRGDAALREVAEIYGLAVPPNSQAQTVGEYLSRRFDGRFVPGDRTHIGAAEFVVRETDGPHVKTVGLHLPPTQRRDP